MKAIILKLFISFSIALLVDILLYFFFKISLAGYYSDVILFWLWFTFSILIIIFYWKKLIAKLFLASIFAASILSVIPMLIPFFAFVNSMTPMGLYQNKRLNENYRAQIVGYSAMVPPQLEIIEKIGLLEKRILVITENDLSEQYEDVRISHAKDIIFNSETDKKLTFLLSFGNPNVPITLDKKTGKLIQLK